MNIDQRKTELLEFIEANKLAEQPGMAISACPPDSHYRGLAILNFSQVCEHLLIAIEALEDMARNSDAGGADGFYGDWAQRTLKQIGAKGEGNG